MLDWFFESNSNLSDEQRGRQAVVEFHNRATAYDGYNLTLEQLLSRVTKNQKIFLESLGKAIRTAEMSSYQVREAMDSLAQASAGRVPAHDGVFFEALYNRVGTLSARDWVNETPAILGNSALQIAEGAAEIGYAAIDIGKTFTQFGPILIVAAVIFIGYAKTRQIAGQ